MYYSLLVDAYEKIEATTKRLEMTDLLVDLVRETPKEAISKVVSLTQGRLYPDYVGIELGLAEKLVLKALSLSTGRSEEEIEKHYKRTGDLGETASKLLSKKAQSTLLQKTLTVDDVYESLNKIARATGEGSVDQKVRFLSRILSDASAREAKYLIRTVLGKLRLGVADMTILDALAIVYGGGKEARAHVERAYNLSSDLGYVATTLAEKGLETIKRFEVTLGRPIRPMLSERLGTANEILEKLGRAGSAEYKYDGLRVQAHISGGQVLLFSRRLENITTQFPDVVQMLSKAARSKKQIVEGECVAVDPNTGDMLPFQMISQRRGRKYEIERMAEEIPITVFLFDLLYVDGQDYTLRTYPARRERLKQIIQESDHVRLSHQIVVEEADALDHFMDQAVSEGCEGLMVKSTGPDSIYKAGARGWLWIKYKRSYKAEVADTFDLVPVGAFYGRGRRKGSYGALLMAAYDDEADVFRTVSKLGSGFTDEDLENLPKIFKDQRLEHDHPRVISLIKADVWLVPTHVLEVSADEITLSPLHTSGRDAIRKDSGLALRFPRFTGKWRRDKSPEDCTTVKEILSMYQNQLKKIEKENTSDETQA